VDVPLDVLELPLPVWWQGPVRVALPDEEDPELLGDAAGEDVLEDVVAEDLLAVAAAPPPDVAAAAMPAPVARPATTTAPPTASLRTAPTDVLRDTASPSTRLLPPLDVRRWLVDRPYASGSPPNLLRGCRVSLRPLSNRRPAACRSFRGN
jgi:hypothetical protein